MNVQVGSRSIRSGGMPSMEVSGSVAQAGARHTLYEPPGVRVLRVRKHLRHRTVFHYPPRVHNVHPLRVSRDDAQVVRDENQGTTEPVHDVPQQLEKLELRGGVKRRRGFVGDDDLGIAGDGHGDHDPLAHPTAELVRVVIYALLCVRDAHHPEQLDASLPSGLALRAQVQLHHLPQLQPNGQGRIQRCHGLLEDHGDLAAPHRPHLPAVGRVLQQLLAFEERTPTRDPSGRGADELHDRELAHGLAAAALAHQADNLALVDLVRDVVDRRHHAAVGVELDLQVLDPQQRFHLDRPPQPRVQGVPESVSHHVEGEDHQHDGDARSEDQFRIGCQTILTVVDHVAPSG